MTLEYLRSLCNDAVAWLGHLLFRFRYGLLWLSPLLVAYLAHRYSERRLVEFVGASIALILFFYMVRRPGAALIALVVFLPLEAVASGLLLNLHIPASTLHTASAFKELMGICILVAALREIRDGNQRLDRIDKALLAYIGVVTLYLLIPHLFSPSAPTAFTPRILAWRADCGYLLIFFGVRHAGITAAQKQRFVRVVLGVGGIIAAAGLYEKAAPGSFIHFMLNRAKQVEYLVNVTHLQPAAAQKGLYVFLNPHPLQVSSIFTSPYDMADYLLLVVGITAARIARNQRSLWDWLLLGATVAVLFFSRVRADSLGALLVLAVAMLPAPRRPVEARLRLILGVAIGAAIIVPSLGGTRFVGGEGGSASNKVHVTEWAHGINVALAHPLGLGLGDQAATATRYQAETGLPPATLLSSGSVAQVSDELGLQALVPWLVTMALIFAELRRRARGPDDLVTGAGLAFLGLFVAAQFHHAFIQYAGPWTMFAAIGLALPGPGPQTVAEGSESRVALVAR